MKIWHPINNSISDYYYFLLLDLLNDEVSDLKDKFHNLKALLDEFFKDVTKTDVQYFSNDFARMIFILDDKLHDKKLSYNVKQLFFFLKSIKKSSSEQLSDAHLYESLLTFAKLIELLSGSRPPKEILSLPTPDSTSLISLNNSKTFNERIKFLQVVVKQIDKENNVLTIVMPGYDDLLNLELGGIWSNIIDQCYRGAVLNLIDVLKKDDLLTTAAGSFIVLEPDYLFDATEIAEAFDYSGFNPFTLFVNRIYRFSTSIHLIIGHIINFIFDSLINFPSADFEEIYIKALKSKPLSLFAVTMNAQGNKQIIREKAYNHFINLKRIIIENNFINSSVEPSFISHLYGFQGRMDLLTEHQDDFRRKDIYELKSGNPAKIDSRFSKDGVFIKTGTYINHFAQVTVYNMLLESCYSDRKGSSTILYSQDDKYPFRNVPNFKKMKQEMVLARNKFIALEYQLAGGDVSIYNSIDSNLFPNAPYWIKDKFDDFKAVLSSLNPIVKDYYFTWVRFVSNELFAVKLGLGTTKSNGNSSLWRNSIEEKISRREVIANLRFVPDESDFDKMHLVFSFTFRVGFSAQFKKGDICIIYPNDPESEFSPYRGRLIKCSVKDITKDRIIIGLRNKLQFELFHSVDTEWLLDFDYSDLAVKSIYKSLSSFINASLEKQLIIMGVKPPRFTCREHNTPDYLSENKKDIYRKALDADDYFLIQGPPGTGKTKFMLRSIVEGIIDESSDNILLIAYTNRAVDEICDAIFMSRKYGEEDFGIIRLGNKNSSVHKSILLSEMTVEKDINSLFKSVKNTRIFAATVSFVLMNMELFNLKKFNTVIVDEASQIIEANIIGILSAVDKFIMIGDEKQLPAIVIQDEQKTRVESEELNHILLDNLNISLFERLLKLAQKNNISDCYAMLDKQARMHSDIMEFPNKFFYEGRLKALDEIKQNSPVTNFRTGSYFFADELSTNRFIFINTPLEMHSKFNLAEVRLVIKLIHTIENACHSFDESTLGIISPFRNQCGLIREAMTEEQRSVITVDTVERYQGTEREIIILSIAANNLYLLDKTQSKIEIQGKIIDRKLNVALTRAKSHIIILGNESILRNSNIYRRLIDFCKSKNSFFDFSINDKHIRHD